MRRHLNIKNVDLLVKYYEILSYWGGLVLNGLTRQEFLNMSRPILSSVRSNLTNYTVRVFLEKQMVSYQVKIPPQLRNPDVHYSNPKSPPFDPLLNYFSLSYILMTHFCRISNIIFWCTSRFSVQYLTFTFFIYNYLKSAPSENEYQEYFLGVKAAGAWGWRPHHLHVPNVMKIWEPKPPGTLWPTPGLLRDSCTFIIT
jgi:hypothetical protein